MARPIDTRVHSWPENPFFKMNLEFLFKHGKVSAWDGKPYDSDYWAARILLPDGWKPNGWTWADAEDLWHEVRSDFLAEHGEDCWAESEWGDR